MLILLNTFLESSYFPIVRKLFRLVFFITTCKDTYEVFYINFSLEEKLQKLVRPLAENRTKFYLTLIKNTLRNDVKQTSKMNEIIKQ